MNTKQKGLAIVAGLGLLVLGSAMPASAATTPDATVASHLEAVGVDVSGDLATFRWKLSDIVVSSTVDGAVVDPAARRYPWKPVCASCRGAVGGLPTPPAPLY